MEGTITERDEALTWYDILSYMNKEAVDGIRNAIEEAKRARKLREEREAARKRTAELTKEEQQQALIARNEARLKATGVVALFQELRDSGVLTIKKDVPAEIKWSSDRLKITIEFDEGTYQQEIGDWPGFEDRTSNESLSATIKPDGSFWIGGRTMKPGEELGEVVRDEILRLKGLKE